MNLILMQKKYPPAIVKLKDRDDYYVALNNANAGDYSLLTEYIAQSLKNALDIYIRAKNGERIEEIGDIDKELSLFVRSFGDNEKTQLEKNNEIVTTILQNSIFPFLETLMRKLETLAPLFHSKTIKLQLRGHNYPIDFNGSNLLAALNKNNNLPQNQILFPDQYSFVHTLESFRKGTNSFSIKTVINFQFDKMQYCVIGNSTEKLTYSYKQMINPEERLEIVENIVKNSMKEIKKLHSEG
jgi:hypothetical protein